MSVVSGSRKASVTENSQKYCQTQRQIVVTDNKMQTKKVETAQHCVS